MLKRRSGHSISLGMRLIDLFPTNVTVGTILRDLELSLVGAGTPLGDDAFAIGNRYGLVRHALCQLDACSKPAN
jgi:hypothetical protein